MRFVVDRGPLDAAFVGLRLEAAMTGLPPRFSRFEIMRELDRERGQSASLVWGRPTRNLARVLIVIVALLVWLDHVGVRVATLIAGLGIGGLAKIAKALPTGASSAEAGELTLYTCRLRNQAASA